MPLDIEIRRGCSHMRAPVQDGELEYDTRGDGEPILFIHGGLIAGDSFRPLFAEPSLADYRLITYHRRGYAGSTAPNVSLDDRFEQAPADAVALLEHIGERRAHVVGHSRVAQSLSSLCLTRPRSWNR
jgi:pimeloyl-ACP methyl ester carboxylesterase